MDYRLILTFPREIDEKLYRKVWDHISNSYGNYLTVQWAFPDIFIESPDK